jgi:photosystem II stability/assembly factor-like uncharacterized protein
MKAVKTLLLVAVTLLAAGFAFAQTWTPVTNAPSNGWTCVASSADGTKLVAVYGDNNSGSIYTSTNSGANWTHQTNAPAGKQWQGVASSADGVKLLAGAAAYGGIYTSTNSGKTWISNNVPNSSNYYWWNVASSADGTKLAAAAGLGGGPIYTSTNSGKTWKITSAPTNSYWAGVTSSADGTKLVAAQKANVTNPNNYLGYIYTSTNSGAMWKQQTNAPFSSWYGIASSADGTKLVAVGRSPGLGQIGGLYTSTNSGGTWTSNAAPVLNSFLSLNWSGVAISADGARIVAVASGSGVSIYASTNSGVSWQTNDAPNANWQTIASSADGSKSVAALYDGGIYTSQTTPSPQLNINPSTNKIAISWIIPSTNFVLQRSSNLLSWANVTNPPTLNLTNLQNQVTLSASNRSGFYRLKTP